MPRLFTGIEIPAEIGERLSLLRGGLPGARWIDRENYHLTLRFVGDIDMDVADEIADALARVSRAGFEADASTASARSARKKPHAIIARVRPTPGARRTAGRARTPAAADRPAAGAAEIHPACDAGAAARRHRPRHRRLSVDPRRLRRRAVHGRPLRPVLLAELDRRRSLCGRGGYPLRPSRATERRSRTHGSATFR